MAAPGKVTPSRPWGLPGDACERGEFVESICARCPKVIVPELGWGALGQDAPLPQYLLHNFNDRRGFVNDAQIDHLLLAYYLSMRAWGRDDIDGPLFLSEEGFS